MVRLSNKFESEIHFDDGIPERPVYAEATPGEYKDKTCSDCVRCTANWREPGKFLCSDINHEGEIRPTDPACKTFWSIKAQGELEDLRDKDIEKRRKELWEIYADKPPVKLPIVYDGYGNIPMCPICGEPTYSTEQCYFCGQHFIQDAELEEYNTVKEERMDCINCGGHNTMVYSRSKYNGHFRGHCEKCGCTIME